MQNVLYKLLLFFLFSLGALTSNAETKTWLGPDGFWADENKWSPVGVPTSDDDVIIPANTTLDINAPAQARSIVVNDGATMDISANLALLENSIFAAGSIVDLVTGLIQFSSEATLSVSGMLNVTNDLDKGIYGGGIVNIIPPGSINFDSAVDLFTLGNAAKLKISSGAVMNIDGDMSFEISAFGIASRLINEGVINKTGGTGTTHILIHTENTNGTLNIASGTVNYGEVGTFINPIYQINESTALIWSGSVKTLEGDITGAIDGSFTVDCSVAVNEGASASFSFPADHEIDFQDFSINFSGTLNNFCTININGISSINNATMGNYGIINLNVLDGINLTNQNAVLENTADGVIYINTATNINSVFGPNLMINAGLIQFQVDGDTSHLYPTLTNEAGGIIDLGAHSVWFHGAYSGQGTMNGSETFALSNNASVFEGHLIPGAPISSLNHASNSNFRTTPTTVYHFDINGTDPGTEHDVFNVQALVDLQGSFELNLMYPAQLNDEFVIMNFADTLATDLPEFVELTYNGSTYTFDVVITDETLTLKVNTIVGIDEYSPLKRLTISPNPTEGPFQIEFPVAGIYTVTIYDLQGRQVATRTANGIERMFFELEGTPGIYLVNIVAGEKQSTYRLVKTQR